MDKLTCEQFNAMPLTQAIDTMRCCCGATAWCRMMSNARPFESVTSVHSDAERCFDQLTPSDWLQAFAAHPKIGDLQSLRMKYAGNKEWSAGEQSAASGADDATLQRLAAANIEYENRFGFIFIVCATGKTAAEMLAILESRLPNSAEDEIQIAAEQQRQITRLRLEKLFK